MSEYNKGDFLTITPEKWGPEPSIALHANLEEAQKEAMADCENGKPSYVVQVLHVAKVIIE